MTTNLNINLGFLSCKRVYRLDSVNKDLEGTFRTIKKFDT